MSHVTRATQRRVSARPPITVPPCEPAAQWLTRARELTVTLQFHEKVALHGTKLTETRVSAIFVPRQHAVV